jgi:hypothetical protein
MARLLKNHVGSIMAQIPNQNHILIKLRYDVQTHFCTSCADTFFVLCEVPLWHLDNYTVGFQIQNTCFFILIPFRNQ